MGDMAGSETGILSSSILTPRSESFASSGMAFDNPPAPTS